MNHMLHHISGKNPLVFLTFSGFECGGQLIGTQNMQICEAVWAESRSHKVQSVFKMDRHMHAHMDMNLMSAVWGIHIRPTGRQYCTIWPCTFSLTLHCLSLTLYTLYDLIISLELSALWTGGRRSPAAACWASDHWVASLNPLRGKFRH